MEPNPYQSPHVADEPLCHDHPEGPGMGQMWVGGAAFLAGAIVLAIITTILGWVR